MAEAWSPENGFRPDSATVAAEIAKIIQRPGGRRQGRCASLDQHAWRTTAMLGAAALGARPGAASWPRRSFCGCAPKTARCGMRLNNLGRRAFHSEGAGAMAHFMAELLAKKPLPIPRVDTAVVTLNTYLHDPDKRSIPIPPREEVGKA
jgi:intracellular multiplication protein IcmP